MRAARMRDCRDAGVRRTVRRMSDTHERPQSRGRVMDDAHDHEFTWPQCDVCHEPLDFHSIQDDPTWFCSECGTVG